MADDELLGQRLEAALAGLEPDDLTDPPPPPPEVWDAIEAEVRAEAEAEARAAAEAEAAAPTEPVVPLAAPAAPGEPAGARPGGGGGAAGRWHLAASIMEPDDPEPQVAARGRAERRAAHASPPAPSGDASCCSHDGTSCSCEVDLADLPPTPAGVVYEVWLIDPDTEELQTLGLTDGRGTRSWCPTASTPRSSRWSTCPASPWMVSRRTAVTASCAACCQPV